MKSLIEYLIISIVLTVFMPNGYLTIAYIVSNLALLSLSLFLMLRHRNEVVFKNQFSLYNLVNIMFIVLVNLTFRIDILNLVFGYICMAYFIICLIISIARKDLAFNKCKFTLKYLFDIYVLFYLGYFLLLKGDLFN